MLARLIEPPWEGVEPNARTRDTSADSGVPLLVRSGSAKSRYVPLVGDVIVEYVGAPLERVLLWLWGIERRKSGPLGWSLTACLVLLSVVVVVAYVALIVAIPIVGYALVRQL